MKFSVSGCLFSIFGWNHQCQCFAAFRGKAVTLKFTLESLQDVWHFIQNFLMVIVKNANFCGIRGIEHSSSRLRALHHLIAY